jgi:oxaloacetate decarboxylase alpha subunit
MSTNSTPLKVTDVVLRDAHQSLLATRMRTEDMLPIGEKLDQVGYFSLEMWGGATFDSCLRFLNEDPWERARKLKKVIPNTPFQMLLRGQNCVGYRHYADDIVERFVKKSVDVGINIFRIFDALNDLRNIETAINAVKKCGETVEGCISYTVSPVHNNELYLKMAQDLVNMGSDIICIKDMAGLLTPDATGKLIREIKKNIDVPVHLHTHATTGLVGMNLQCAIDAGVDMVDTAISSLSMGTSHYATECIVAAQKGLPRDTGLDLGLLEEISNYFREVRKNYAEFESDFKGVDINILKSQIPGGMISNMENQLKEQNALDKLGEVLEEVPRVRKDMGYPPLVTPTSQIVGSQATLNVLTGQRYKLITKETRECILGKYGKLPAPLDPDLLAKAQEKGEVIDCRPADLLEPEWDQVVKDCKGKCTSEEDMLSYALFPKVALEFFKNREQGFPSAEKTATPTPKPVTTSATPATPIAGSATYTVNVNGQAFSVQVSAGGTPQQVLSAPAPAAAPAANGTSVTSPLPGSVFALKVTVGDQVSEGDVVIIMESMKMETEVHATASGTINSIQVQEGQKVNTGDNLLVIG